MDLRRSKNIIIFSMLSLVALFCKKKEETPKFTPKITVEENPRGELRMPEPEVMVLESEDGSAIEIDTGIGPEASHANVTVTTASGEKYSFMVCESKMVYPDNCYAGSGVCGVTVQACDEAADECTEGTTVTLEVQEGESSDYFLEDANSLFHNEQERLKLAKELKASACEATEGYDDLSSLGSDLQNVITKLQNICNLPSCDIVASFDQYVEDIKALIEQKEIEALALSLELAEEDANSQVEILPDELSSEEIVGIAFGSLAAVAGVTVLSVVAVRKLNRGKKEAIKNDKTLKDLADVRQNLDANLETSQERVDSLKKRIGELEQRVKDLDELLEDKTLSPKKKQELEKLKASVQETLDSHKARLKEQIEYDNKLFAATQLHKQTISDLEDKVKSSIATSENIKAELEDLQKTSAKVKKALKDSKVREDALTKEKIKLQKDLEAQQEINQKALADNKDLAQKLKLADDAARTRTAKMAQLRTQLDASEKKNVELQNVKAQLEALKKAQTMSGPDKDTTIRDLQARVAALEPLEDVKQELEALRTQQTDGAEAQAKLQQLADKLSTLETSLELEQTSGTGTPSLEDRVNKLVKSADAQKDKLARLTLSDKEQQRIIAELKEKLAAKNAETTTTSAEKQRLVEELQKLKTQHTAELGQRAILFDAQTQELKQLQDQNKLLVQENQKLKAFQDELAKLKKLQGKGTPDEIRAAILEKVGKDEAEIVERKKSFKLWAARWKQKYIKFMSQITGKDVTEYNTQEFNAALKKVTQLKEELEASKRANKEASSNWTRLHGALMASQKADTDTATKNKTLLKQVEELEKSLVGYTELQEEYGKALKILDTFKVDKSKNIPERIQELLDELDKARGKITEEVDIKSRQAGEITDQMRQLRETKAKLKVSNKALEAKKQELKELRASQAQSIEAAVATATQQQRAKIQAQKTEIQRLRTGPPPVVPRREVVHPDRISFISRLNEYERMGGDSQGFFKTLDQTPKDSPVPEKLLWSLEMVERSRKMFLNQQRGAGFRVGAPDTLGSTLRGGLPHELSYRNPSAAWSRRTGDLPYRSTTLRLGTRLVADEEKEKLMEVISKVISSNEEAYFLELFSQALREKLTR